MAQASQPLQDRVLGHIDYWLRFPGDPRQKVQMVLSDPQWVRLMEMQGRLEPLSQNARLIRRQIALLQRCHEHYVQNVQALVEMIGQMKPGQIVDCGQACRERQLEARRYAMVLQQWISQPDPAPADDPLAADFFARLGEPTARKQELVRHLRAKLLDAGYRVYNDADEDFHTIESRIQHLQPCNFNWEANLRIVLEEIGSGRQLYGWHERGGFASHGDCPDRIADLADVVSSSAAWAQRQAHRSGRWGEILGHVTDEKRWLVGSLCKTIAAQHREFGGEQRLDQPRL
jgi:hypothetical protein